MEIDELLQQTVDKGASDLHLMVSSPPVFRIDGALTPQEDIPPLLQKKISIHSSNKLLFQSKEPPLRKNWNWILPIVSPG
jgi:Tfp pilus assembly pilus retraction ATPase PilT